MASTSTPQQQGPPSRMDTKGNLTGDGVWTYSYDLDNQLVSANCHIPSDYIVFLKLPISQAVASPCQSENQYRVLLPDCPLWVTSHSAI